MHHGTRMVCLHGHCSRLPDDSGDRDGTVADRLALNIAADNAEAHDRAQRGENGYRPWWPLSARSIRQQPPAGPLSGDTGALPSPTFPRKRVVHRTAGAARLR